MPQFVPPPLNPSPEEEHFGAPAKPTNRHERYAFEAKRLIVDLPRMQRLAREGTIPDEFRQVYWMTLLGTLPLQRSQRDAAHATMLKDYSALVRDLLTDLRDAPMSLDHDPRRIDVDIPRTMPSLHFYASHETSSPLSTSGVASSPLVGESAKVSVESAATTTRGHEEDAAVTEQPATAVVAVQGRRKVDSSSTHGETFTPNQLALRRVLHLFAKLNAGAGYVQGMNEMVGHLMYAMCAGKGMASSQTEADVFFSFQRLHQFVGDNFQRELDLDANGVKGTLTAYSTLLMRCDYELFQELSGISLEPEYYAFRWITLMFSQDFTVPDVLSLWDFLLSYREDLDAAVQFTAVAMTTLLRDRLLASNFGAAIQMLQSYPPDIEIHRIKQRAQELIAEHGFEAARDGRGGPSSSRSGTPSGAAGNNDSPPGRSATSTNQQSAEQNGGGAAASFANSVRGLVSGFMKRVGK